jgi:hypothetical protein
MKQNNQHAIKYILNEFLNELLMSHWTQGMQNYIRKQFIFYYNLMNIKIYTSITFSNIKHANQNIHNGSTANNLW